MNKQANQTSLLFCAIVLRFQSKSNSFQLKHQTTSIDQKQTSRKRKQWHSIAQPFIHITLQEPLIPILLQIPNAKVPKQSPFLAMPITCSTKFPCQIPSLGTPSSAPKPPKAIPTTPFSPTTKCSSAVPAQTNTPSPASSLHPASQTRSLMVSKSIAML